VVDDDPRRWTDRRPHAGLATTVVLRAYGGREAIDIARQAAGLIVLDLMMPDVNGFDVVEALSKHPTPRAFRSWWSPPSRSRPRTARS
jgi:CheY-like chemotaxis protein